MSHTASSYPGSTSKLFYFHQPTVSRSPSTASTSSSKSSSSSTSSPSASSTSSWSPTLSSITTEESYFNTRRPSSDKATLFAPSSACSSTCRCTRCCLGDFVFDTEDDYRDYLEVIAQAREAGAVLDQSATRTSDLSAKEVTVSGVARSSSCPPTTFRNEPQ